jgi:hypothetical protein
VIHSVSWYSAESAGCVTVGGPARQIAPPDLADTEALQSAMAAQVKNLGRMPRETRACLFAAALASQSAPARSPEKETGILIAGHDGCLPANRQYFLDYVECGRSLGRGNLFIYTLPTSTIGEISIALNLAGPSMYLHDDAQPLQALLQTAEQMITDGEAAGFIALWTDDLASIAFVLGPGESIPGQMLTILRSGRHLRPLQLAKMLQQMVQPA